MPEKSFENKLGEDIQGEIDRLIEKMSKAKTREEQIAILKADLAEEKPGINPEVEADILWYELKDCEDKGDIEGAKYWQAQINALRSRRRN